MPPFARERSKRERHDEEPRADDDYRRRREGRDAREGSRDVPAYEKDTSNADGESDRDQDQTLPHQEIQYVDPPRFPGHPEPDLAGAPRDGKGRTP